MATQGNVEDEDEDEDEAAIQQSEKISDRQADVFEETREVNEGEEGPESSDEDSEDEDDFEDAPDDELEASDFSHYFSAEEDTADGQDPRARVLSVLELEDLFLKTAPNLSGMHHCVIEYHLSILSLQTSFRIHRFFREPPNQTRCGSSRLSQRW